MPLRNPFVVTFIACCIVASWLSREGQAWQESGFQPRHGDEIMVCGQFYRIGTPVKLWLDPGGFDAYRTQRRFSEFEERKWKETVDAMKAGKLEFVSKPQEFVPDRFGMRFENAPNALSNEEREQVRGGGWTLPMLQTKVDQFVLHFDACGTSTQCFYILHDRRGLSVHFLLDVDGTIYQTLDLKERAWHATKSNDRSIGVEIASPGCFAPNSSKKAFADWYKTSDDGRVQLIFPPYVRGAERFLGKSLGPRRPETIQGQIHGRDYEQYDFTQAQYDALIKLSAALCTIFPKMKADAPRGDDGKVLNRLLTDEEWNAFGGILGHYHIQLNKSDPGPAMDWDFYLDEVKRHQLKARP
jgi:N-acetylmuramoyl-L-alanine amidase